MMILKIAAFALGAFFAVCGIAFVAGILSELALRPERRRMISVIPLTGDDTELLLRAASFNSGVSGASGRIIAVDRGLDAEQRGIAERIAAEIDGITVVDSDTFCRMFSDGELD